MKYYYLLIKYEPDDDWAIEFGDYKRSVVKEEMDCLSYPAKQMKIVTMADDKQATINAYLSNWRKSL